MDCRKAKQRLNKSGAFSDKEFLEHLESCPDCTREANAARLLDKSFQTVGQEYENEATPLSTIQSKVTEKIKNDLKKEIGIMTQIKNEVSRRPKLVAGLALAITVFLFITLVPFSYTRIVGYDVAFSDVGELEKEQLRQIDNGLSALGFNNISINGSNSSISITGLPTRAAAEEVTILINSIIGKAINSQIKAITETVSGSLYAQALEKKRTIEINARGKSSDEIREEIRRKLIAEGFSDPEVFIEIVGDSVIDISVKMSDTDTKNTTEGVLELKISADTDSFEMPVMEKVSDELKIDMEGKTDAEIKAEIEEKLAREGKEGAKVEVITRPDGQKEIRIEIEKEIEK